MLCDAPASLVIHALFSLFARALDCKRCKRCTRLYDWKKCMQAPHKPEMDADGSLRRQYAFLKQGRPPSLRVKPCNLRFPVRFHQSEAQPYSSRGAPGWCANDPQRRLWAPLPLFHMLSSVDAHFARELVARQSLCAPPLGVHAKCLTSEKS